MDNDSKVKVFIVDDHPLIIEGIKGVFCREPDMVVCGHAGSISDGLRGICSVDPDICIVDIGLQDGSGIELTKEIKKRFPGMPILILSMQNDEVYAERALRAGASGYVRKISAARTIIEAIRQVLRGEVYLSDTTTSNILSHLVGGKSGSPYRGVDSLSDREMQVFELMGQGMTNPEISGKCYLSIRSVESYFKRIKEKLGLKSTVQIRQLAIQWARSNLVA